MRCFSWHSYFSILMTGRNRRMFSPRVKHELVGSVYSRQASHATYHSPCSWGLHIRFISNSAKASTPSARKLFKVPTSASLSPFIDQSKFQARRLRIKHKLAVTTPRPLLPGCHPKIPTHVRFCMLCIKPPLPSPLISSPLQISLWARIRRRSDKESILSSSPSLRPPSFLWLLLDVDHLWEYT